MQNIYVMSDIHGNYKAFLEKLDIIDLKDTDKLYILGDVVDRGYDGIEIIDYIRSCKNIELLMGNHEEMMYEEWWSDAECSLSSALTTISRGGSDVC